MGGGGRRIDADTLVADERPPQGGQHGQLQCHGDGEVAHESPVLSCHVQSPAIVPRFRARWFGVRAYPRPAKKTAQQAVQQSEQFSSTAVLVLVGLCIVFFWLTLRDLRRARENALHVAVERARKQLMKFHGDALERFTKDWISDLRRNVAGAHKDLMRRLAGDVSAFQAAQDASKRDALVELTRRRAELETRQKAREAVATRAGEAVGTLAGTRKELWKLAAKTAGNK